MNERDVAGTLQKVAELRRLCLALPHLETPAERRHLARFAKLTAAPSAVTADDVDALAAGWSRWWRQGEVARIGAMAAQLPRELIATDRRLATLAEAARVSLREAH